MGKFDEEPIRDVSEPFKRQRLTDEPHTLHEKSEEIQDLAEEELGVADDFKGSHFLTTDGKLLGEDGRREHRSMSDQILHSFPDEEFNEMAENADSKKMSRWGTDGRNMSRLLEQTGMARVSADKTGINIDAKHPLTKSQRSVIKQHIEDNDIDPDRVWIDDDTPSQNTIAKQVKFAKGGFMGNIFSPTQFTVGEKNKKEFVTIKPKNDFNFFGSQKKSKKKSNDFDFMGGF